MMFIPNLGKFYNSDIRFSLQKSWQQVSFEGGGGKNVATREMEYVRLKARGML